MSDAAAVFARTCAVVDSHRVRAALRLATSNALLMLLGVWEDT